MTSWRDITTLGILFLSLYFEVFMLVTYVRRRQLLLGRAKKEAIIHPDLPSVTIIVPCYNEEKTLGNTINSLLALDYPKEKLYIMVINDGSTDNTRASLQKFATNPQVEILHKENGGKHTVLNLGIERATTEFIGCLDADSYVESDALLRIVKRFKDPEVMSVVPSIHIFKPGTPIQKMQKVEYTLGIFWRSILAELNSLYVTPGPFSIFRKSVFEKVGSYRKAHNTEDMEMALRLHSNHMKIAFANDAVVHTSSPKTIPKLYRQRVRWVSGFLKNVHDYKHMLFNTKYGNFSAFILPVMTISLASILFIVSGLAYDVWRYIHSAFLCFEAIGLRMFEWTGWSSWGFHSWNWFFIHTSPIVIVGIISLAFTASFVIIGSRLSDVKLPRLADIVWYAMFNSIIAPLWLLHSIINFVFGKQTIWR